MKIRITTDLPVETKNRPKKGSVYEVEEESRQGRRKLYFVTVNGIRVGVFPNECEIVEEE